MKIKTKYISILTVLFICFTLKMNGQEERIKLKGNVKYNTTNLENINIINKAVKMGTASNADGIFEIIAAKGDSIEFSSIEYQNRTIVITENHINSKYIAVYLEPGFNELDEVEILQSMRLDVSKVPVQQRAQLDIDEMDLREAPDAKDLSGYNTQLTNGMDLIQIYSLLTKKSRAKKRSENDLKNEIEHIKQELPTTLKNAYGDDFFTEWLHIENDEIYEFLDFCQANGLGDFYKSEEIYIKDFLIKQSVNFNKTKGRE